MLSPNRFQYKRPKTSFNLWNHLSREMFGWGEPGSLKPPGKENIVNFLHVPYQLECFLMLGLFMCLDAFLYIFTFLPLRVVLGSLSLLQELPVYVLSLFMAKSSIENLYSRYSILPRFHRTQGFDLMRAAMLGIAVVALHRINMSQAYHFIRGQSMIKLYVLMGMMEVMDKLMCSFGQDVFDALHNATRRAPMSRATWVFFGISVLYVIAHAVFYFYQVATYMVVVNSADEALVTVLILNNFSELRGFVFKKFDANNLFQCACSDVSERFQIMLFLSIVFLVTLAQQVSASSSFVSMFSVAISALNTAVLGNIWGTIMPSDVARSIFGEGVATQLRVLDAQFDSLQSPLYMTLLSMMRCMVYMVLSETLSDCVKHAFMNKFNAINASVYEDFAYILRADLLNYQCDTIVLDHTYSVTRRLGLAQIPLAAVTLRYILLAVTRVTVALQHTQQGSPALGAQGHATSLVWDTFVAPLSRYLGWTSLTSDLFSGYVHWAFWIFWVWVGLVIVKVCLGVSLVIYADDRQRKDAKYVYQRAPLEADRLKLSAATPAPNKKAPVGVSQKKTLNTAVSTAKKEHKHPVDNNPAAVSNMSANLATQETHPGDVISGMSTVQQLLQSAVKTVLGDGADDVAEESPPGQVHSRLFDDTAVPDRDTVTHSGHTAITDSNKTPHHSVVKNLNEQFSTEDNEPLPLQVDTEDTETQHTLNTEPDEDTDGETTESQTETETQQLLAASPVRQQHAQDRVDFLEKLATMERYTVYNGRII